MSSVQVLKPMAKLAGSSKLFQQRQVQKLAVLNQSESTGGVALSR
jgi:hypothetical protein